MYFAPNSFGYDSEGRLSSGYGSSYTFDYEHRLTGFSGASFSYDGGGNRLQAVRSGVTNRYVYGGGNLLAETDGANNITRYYIYGAGLLAMVTPADQVYCYHYNGTGSTIAMTDQSQAMVNKYAYDPFGKVANQEETVPQPFKYVGQYGVMAEPNGFYYMRARYYDPNVGRFVSEDPIGFGGGDVNLFAYVQNNPVNAIDPLGLSGWLTIYSNGGPDITSGHSWISYTPNSSGTTTTYGTWGNTNPTVLQVNRELGVPSDASRSAYLNDAQEAQLYSKINEYASEGPNGWGYLNPCSGFAADSWEAATDESLSHRSYFIISNPTALRGSIIEANGGKSTGTKKP